MTPRRFFALLFTLALLLGAPARFALAAAPAPSAALPSQQRYVQAMSNPRHYVTDPKLAGRLEVERNDHGAPLTWSGSFGTVFKGQVDGRTPISIRVFHGQRPEAPHLLAARYQKLHDFVTKLDKSGQRPPELIDSAFVSDGLQIDGKAVPILKMPWAQGRQLDEWIGSKVGSGDTEAVATLAGNWRAAMSDMRAIKMAHGDLHHGNVKVENDGSMRFLDYDAVYVPSMKGMTNAEIGHPNYQHPSYHFDGDGNLRAVARPFDEKLDNFSSIVVYVSMRALAADPSLWKQFHGEENLIFEGKRDFVSPDHSPVFAALARSPSQEVRTLSAKLALYAKGSASAVPSLEEALDGVRGAGRAQPFGARAGIGTVLASRRAPAEREQHPSLLTLGSQRVDRFDLVAQAAAARAMTPAAAPARVASVAAAALPVRARATGAAPIVPTIRNGVPKVSTKEPGLLVLLTDASSSMSDPFSPGVRKADALADVANGALAEFVRANNQGGTIRDRWNVAALHYGGEDWSPARSALEGELRHHDTVPLSKLANHPADVVQVPDVEGQMVSVPLWIRPAAGGRTPMSGGFEGATRVVDGFMRKRQSEHLVLAVHVTDGEYTDADPTDRVAALAKRVEAGGGKLLMTNIHISSNGGKGVVFPTPAQAAKLDEYGKLLFSLSSEVPPELAEQLGTEPGARMMAYNAGVDQLARVFRAGSSVAGGAVAH